MKRLIAILLTLVIAFSLVGCGKLEGWHALPLSQHLNDSYYVNIYFENLDVGTYNVNFKRGNDGEEAPGILFVQEDRYDLLLIYPKDISAGYYGTSVLSFPK